MNLCCKTICFTEIVFYNNVIKNHYRIFKINSLYGNIRNQSTGPKHQPDARKTLAEKIEKIHSSIMFLHSQAIWSKASSSAYKFENIINSKTGARAREPLLP